MKTAKSALQACAQEECGVWLDTVQLKGKAKHKKRARPISKLLNPLANGEGYSLSVALNFTQTKLQMPKTKQSSISSFFAPQRSVLHKMSTSSEEINKVVVEYSASTSSTSSNTTKCASPAPTLIAFGTKQQHDPDLQLNYSGPHNTEEVLARSSHTGVRQGPAGYKQKCEGTASKYNHEERDATPLFSINYESEEDEAVKEPERKRRITEALSCMVKSVPLGDQCKDQQMNCDCPQSNQNLSEYRESQWDSITQDYQSTRVNLSDQEHPVLKPDQEREVAFIETLQTEAGFGSWLAVERTSTQKPLQHNTTSQVVEEKGNNVFVPTSTYECSLSYKCAESNMVLPQNHIPLQKELHNSYRVSQTKSNDFPLKMGAVRRTSSAVEEDSLALLFTQDSQGFKVIAHRGLLARSPLKDQTNVGSRKENRSVPCKSFSDYEDEEILFTQDSQGNMVIKH